MGRSGPWRARGRSLSRDQLCGRSPQPLGYDLKAVLDVAPVALVGRFFLYEVDLGVGVLFKVAFDLIEGEWRDLLEPDDANILWSSLAYLALRGSALVKQLIVELARTDVQHLCLFRIHSVGRSAVAQHGAEPLDLREVLHIVLRLAGESVPTSLRRKSRFGDNTTSGFLNSLNSCLRRTWK